METSIRGQWSHLKRRITQLLNSLPYLYTSYVRKISICLSKESIMNDRYGINYSLYSKWHFWLFFFLLTCIPKSQKYIIIGKKWKKGISIHWHKWFLFSDLRHNCFTFQCHEMLLWSNATRPTVHTQSTILPNPASIPPVLFILATGFWGGWADSHCLACIRCTTTDATW